MNAITQSKTIDAGRMFIPYQGDIIRCRSRFMLCEKARRIGLTYALIYKFVLKRALQAGKTYYTAQVESTVLEAIDYVVWFAKLLNAGFEPVGEEILDEKNGITAKRVTFKNGGSILGLSSNPIALHGKGGDWICDEFALVEHAAEMYEAGINVVRWGDDAVILSTHTSVESTFNSIVTGSKRLQEEAVKRGILPLADNAEYIKLARELKVLPWNHSRTTIHDAVNDGLVEKINEKRPVYESREAFLDECRSSCLTEDQWKRQYLCEPSSDSTALLPYNLILTCVEDRCLSDLKTASEALYQGGDIGRHNHPSVLATGEKLGDVVWLRDLKRLVKMPFRDQLTIADGIIGLPQFRGGAYDQTGIGEMPIEELQHKWGEWRIEGIKFTADAKHQLAIGLRRAFEDRTIRIPRDPLLYEALNKVRCSYGINGLPRYEARDEGDTHGDEFWAVAMMIYKTRVTAVPGTFRAFAPSRITFANSMRKERACLG